MRTGPDVLDWNDLRYVLAIARARGASEAAEALGVHASTVFRRLNALESALGVRLFERLADGYAPTAAGEEMSRAAERMEADIAVLNRRLAGRDLRPSGSLRVTTTDTLLELLTPHLAAFQGAHREIVLHVVVANRFFDLTRHDADVAIRPAVDAPPALVGRRLATIASAIYGASAYLAGRSDTSDLTKHDWIGPDESLAHLASVRWLHRSVSAQRIRYRANSLTAMLEAARHGLGLVPLPCFLGDAEPDLRRIRPPVPELESALWLLTHEDLRHVARVRVFLDFMADALMVERVRLSGRA